MKPWLFWVCLVAFFLDFFAIFVAPDLGTRQTLGWSMALLAFAMVISTRK